MLKNVCHMQLFWGFLFHDKFVRYEKINLVEKKNKTELKTETERWSFFFPTVSKALKEI